MLTVLNITSSIFIIIAIGFLTVKRGLLGHKDTRALGVFVIDYALPADYPTFGTSSRVELLGTKGVVLIDDDSRDQIVYADDGIPHSYVPGHRLKFAFMSSTAYGDWIQGEFWGPLADETRSWLDHLATGRPCSVTTGAEGRRTLEVTYAVEEASHTGKVVMLPRLGNRDNENAGSR